MEYKCKNNGIVVTGADSFNITHTFTCGQCFRWVKEQDGSFTGIAHGRAVNIADCDGGFVINNTTQEDFNRIWRNYLDLDTNYTEIKNGFLHDEYLKKAISFGGGIHILNQDIFECLISFIISTQNQIPRIMKIVSALSQMFGGKISCNGKTYYTFPTLKQLQNVKESDLAELKAGYRAEYIVDAINKILYGDVDLYSIEKYDIDKARAELMKIKGVGPKVADCVLLFSAKKSNAFPIDVWVKRTMKNLYLGDKATNRQILEFAQTHFGKFAGMAQQYLFYYSRENSLK